MQGYNSIRTNVKAFLIFVSIPFSFPDTLLYVFRNFSHRRIRVRFLFELVRYNFLPPRHSYGLLFLSMFNPLCFVGHSRDFAVLEQRCNQLGKIAAATRRLIDYFHYLDAHYVATNV